MTETNTRGKHRASRRSPIAGLAEFAASPGARRGAVVAASSGLVLTMAATTASAAVEGVSVRPQVGETTLSESALASIALAPTVTVAADVAWETDAISVAAAKPAPAPVQTVQQSSRTYSRTSTGAQSSAAAAPVAATGSRAAVVSIARQYIGTPYVHGGATPAGFDCSGFTQYVFAKVGVSLPRTSSAQRYAGVQVSAAQAQPGDLVWAPGHVGIYTGNGQHIAARQPGTALYESPIYMSSPIFIRVLG